MTQTTDFLKSRRKYFVASIVIFLSFNLFFTFIADRYIIAYTRAGHYCLPYKAWLIKKHERPGRGDYVSFVGHGIPTFADGVRWVKVMSGVPGDQIRTVKIPEQDRATNTETIEVNGLPVQKRLQGRVYLHAPQTAQVNEFSVYEKDTMERALPMINSQTIPSGHYYVTAPAPRSYDSRYWGLIHEEDILGKAYPLF
jgi:conjugal transfer pilin signal peptidase TrbI